jgi:hypothetical protein
MSNKAEKKKDFFWLSFADVMTSLFFVMLVLFVLVYSMQNKLIGDLRVSKKAYERILAIENQLDRLQENPSFQYLPECRKYVVKSLTGQEIFLPNESVIKPEFISTTIKAGNDIQEFLKILSKNEGQSYILILEGNMANTYDMRINPESIWGYKISYERAHAVYELWRKNGINLRDYNTEVIISGSGFTGVCREPIEENNKRFSIQILPKIEAKKI